MSLTINTNHAAVTAGYNLSRNNDALQRAWPACPAESESSKPRTMPEGLPYR